MTHQCSPTMNKDMKTKMNALKPIIWTISGSDCSGGAGIAADIKTGHVFGVEVCHLITANTVQNSEEMLAINPVDVGILEQQFQALLHDKTPKALKVGMLANDEQIQWLITCIKRLKHSNIDLLVILDPVATASAGGVTTTISSEALQQLYPHIDVITPNLPEAEKLTGIYLGMIDEIAEKFSNFGIKNMVIKGGHSTDYYCIDHAYQFACAGTLEHKFSVSSAKIITDYSHGGGCSFATSIAALLSQGHLLRDALAIAKAFITQGLLVNKSKIHYYGAFEHTCFPKLASSYPQIELTQPLISYPTAEFTSLGIKRDGRQSLGLYPVVDSLAWLERLLPLGLEIIQLRVKKLSGEELSDTIKQAVQLSRKYQTRLFINDHWELAIKHGAYGVHLGQEDIYLADLAAIQRSGIRLGISTHGVYEFLLAQQLRPSYLAIGAIYHTKTKDMTGQIQGLETLANTLNVATDIPVVAIGGINHQRATSVWQTGVDSIAVVTAITEADDPEQAVAKFNQQLN